MMMKFGFDIDDTLINLREYAFHLYNKKLDQNVSIEEFRKINTLEIHEVFGLKKEDGGKLWMSLAEEIYFSDCEAFTGAVEILQKLEAAGHEIYYITARHSKYCEQTKVWMKDKGFPVRDENFYCGMKDDEKIDIIKKLNLDYYFDDKPAVLETLLDVSTNVYAVDNAYNQHVKLPRIKDWSELEHIL